ncbi:MAG: ABC transporter permease [Caldisericota bacterium]|nr:ABC transporter permease [Caldisericota bacterium]
MLKKIVYIALHSLKIVFRDRGTLIWLILIPIIWTTLIGTMSTPRSGNEKIPVGFFNRDKGIYGETFKSTLEKEEGIEIIGESDKTNMKARVKKSELFAGLLIPENFSENLMNGKSTTIEILKSGKSSSYFLDELITKTANRISIDALSANFTLEKLRERKIIPDEQEENIWRKIFQKADTSFNPIPPIRVEYNILSVEKRDESIPNGMNASSPGFAVMFVMMGVLFAAVAMVGERHNKTLASLLTTPTRKFSIISGKMFSFFLVGFIQFMILIIFGQFILKVNWGNSLIGVLLLTISYVLSVTGIGMLLSVFIRTSAQAGAFAVLISIVTSMFGGAWWPIEIVPKFMQNVARFTPQYWAINGFNKIITRGFGAMAILPNFYVLLIFSIVTLFFAVMLFKFE